MPSGCCLPARRTRWVSVLLRPVRPPVSEVVCPGCGGEEGARGQEVLIWVPRPALWAQGTLPEEGSVGGAWGPVGRRRGGRSLLCSQPGRMVSSLDQGRPFTLSYFTPARCSRPPALPTAWVSFL